MPLYESGLLFLKARVDLCSRCMDDLFDRVGDGGTVRMEEASFTSAAVGVGDVGVSMETRGWRAVGESRFECVLIGGGTEECEGEDEGSFSLSWSTSGVCMTMLGDVGVIVEDDEGRKTKKYRLVHY